MNIKRKKEWFDNEAFWQDLYPITFPEVGFAQASQQVEKLLTLVRPAGKTALDLCCGPGRHSIPLARAGFHVTGVDKTKYLLDQARVKAKAAKVDIEWVRKDMRDFARDNAFDMVINMWGSFGYFNDEQEDLQVLGNILTSLKPGGACVIDTLGKERLAKDFPTTTSEVLPDGTRLIQRHEVCDDWTRVQSEWILIRKTRAKTFAFRRTIYSGRELRDRMEQVGFADVKLYGNLDGDKYGPDAPGLIAVGRRTIQ